MNPIAAWATFDGHSLVHATVDIKDTVIYARGAAVVTEQRTPVSVWYEIECDGQWRVRRVDLSVLTTTTENLVLVSDGEGHWTDADGHGLSELEGCIDIDLDITPFTNTLPIRRLNWARGKSSTLKVAYWNLPNIKPRRVDQRYTCLKIGELWLYEDLVSATDYTLPTDADGLVLDYPGIFKRL
jgi:uncharacterized protein